MNAIELVQQDLRKTLTPTSKWRTVIELSTMINNDEVVVYSDAQIESVDESLGGTFGRAVVRLSRPVFKEENLALVNAKAEVEKTTKLTRLLDAAYKIGQIWQIHNKYGAKEMGKFIVEHVAYSYYDCMSGGMPLSEILIARRLIEKLGVNLNEEVYPSKEGWSTVADFLKETNNVEGSEHI